MMTSSPDPERAPAMSTPVDPTSGHAMSISGYPASGYALFTTPVDPTMGQIPLRPVSARHATYQPSNTLFVPPTPGPSPVYRISSPFAGRSTSRNTAEAVAGSSTRSSVYDRLLAELRIPPSIGAGLPEGYPSELLPPFGGNVIPEADAPGGAGLQPQPTREDPPPYSAARPGMSAVQAPIPVVDTSRDSLPGKAAHHTDTVPLEADQLWPDTNTANRNTTAEQQPGLRSKLTNIAARLTRIENRYVHIRQPAPLPSLPFALHHTQS